MHEGLRLATDGSYTLLTRTEHADVRYTLDATALANAGANYPNFPGRPRAFAFPLLEMSLHTVLPTVILLPTNDDLAESSDREGGPIR